MRFVLASILPCCFSFVTVLSAGTAVVYRILPSPDSRFALEVEKTGLLSGKKHLFLFERYQGTLHFDRESPENSRIELAIEGASALCKDTWVSAKDLVKIQKLALEEMMEVAKHPQLLFTSEKIIPKGVDAFQVQGRLAVRGISQPASVTVTLKPQVENLLVSGNAGIRLKDYGLKPPGALLGTIGTKNEMTVSFALAAQPVR